MKKRRTVIVAFLLLAVMTIGIGYAAIVDTLDITGTADLSTSNAFDANIFFSNAVADGQTGNTAKVNDDNNDKASFSAASMIKEGDTAVFTFTIQNDNNRDAKITMKTHSNTDDTHFGIAMTWEGGEDAYGTGAELTVAAGQSAEVTVTITLVSLPSNYTAGQVLSATFVNELNVDDGAAASAG